MTTTTVRLRLEVEKDLEDVAISSRRSKSWLVNEALSDYLERRKAAQARWEQTLEAMESVAQGRIASGDAVHGWLKSWGTAEEGPPPEPGE